MIGQTVSHYRILEKLGAGGMGEVYRATDSHLGRDVAIKVLPDAFARDAERLARFGQEARLLAALNHPQVAAIYGLEECEGLRFLVLELVPGPTLAERLVAGPLPVEEALEICRQVAGALEAAHERGIIHRDLKPPNIKVTAEGKVKVLDFGLAKVFEADAATADLSKSPTATYRTAGEGVILGTAAYMSPEQARGKPLDKRTDIWSFGCVLYELLTGQQAFTGETISDTMAAILRGEPDWRALPASTPPIIRLLLQRCLEKDAHRRLRDIGDARVEIEDALAGRGAPPALATVVSAPLWQRALPWALAGLMTVAAAAIGVLWRASRMTPPVVQLAVPLPATGPLVLGNRPAIAISPDGARLVYVARQSNTTQLYLRALDQLESKPIPGTEGGEDPFFSPDGQWIGFFVGGKLKKVSVQGGAPLTLCDAPLGRGASWGSDDTIVFSPTSITGLWRVSAGGGARQRLTTPDKEKGELSHRWPQVLPGGKAALFTIETSASFGEAPIGLLDLKTGKWRTLIEGGTFPRYVPTGHIVYARAGTLLAVPFDLKRLEVTGPPAPVLEGVAMDRNTGAAQFSVSEGEGGSLVYLPGGAQAAAWNLVWVDRKGVAHPLAAPARLYGQPSLSPDGRRVATAIAETNTDIWVYEIGRGTLTRLTFQPGEDESPVWTPDGRRVAFSSSVGVEPRAIFGKNADGSGTEERIVTAGTHTHLSSFSPDGRLLAFTDYESETRGDIWLLPLQGEHKPQVFLKTPFNERDAKFSPDGHWIAYTSDESGRDEIYVQPFPGPGGKRQVSTEGGYGPVWARNGRELFYRDGEKIMAIAVTIKPGFMASPPRRLFQERYDVSARREANYDVSPDGRFLMIKASEGEVAPAELHVVLNWFEELKRRVPAGKPR